MMTAPCTLIILSESCHIATRVYSVDFPGNAADNFRYVLEILSHLAQIKMQLRKQRTTFGLDDTQRSLVSLDLSFLGPL